MNEHKFKGWDMRTNKPLIADGRILFQTRGNFLLQIVTRIGQSKGLADKASSNIKRVIMCLLAVVFSDKRVVSRAFLLPTCLMQVACVLFDAFIRSFSRLFYLFFVFWFWKQTELTWHEQGALVRKKRTFSRSWTPGSPARRRRRALRRLWLCHFQCKINVPPFSNSACKNKHKKKTKK